MVDTSGFGSMTFRIAAALISMTCIFYTLLMRTKKRAKSNLFVTLLVLTFIDSITGIIQYIAEKSPFSLEVRYAICYACKLAYFVTHFAFIPVFFFYILMVCGVMYKLHKAQRIIVIAPIAALEILLFLNPLLHFVFERSGDLEFVRRPGIYVAYGIAALYVTFCIGMLFKYWKNISVVKRVAMTYFMLLVIFGTVIQMVYIDIKCELLADAIGLMGIMIMIEKDDDRIDLSTMAYNRNAFLYDLNNLFLLGREFVTICVRIDNGNSYRKIVGFDNYDKILKEIADFLVNIDKKYDVYRVEESCFYILCPGIGGKELESMLFAINERFMGSFDVGEGATRIKAKILAAKTPGKFNSVDDIFLMSETEFEDGEKSVYMGADLDFLVRRIEVEKAIGRGIAEKNFTVFYQPMYRQDTGKVYAAEASLNLNDSLLGEIKAEEFVKVAEGSGFIEELESRMIESVFRFLGTGVDRSDMQIEFVLIHLMSLKIISRETINMVKELFDRFRIEPSLIVFEISEQDAYLGYDNLDYVISKFKDMGVKLYLGNYSSGYMDLRASYSFGFEGMMINVQNILDESGFENGKIVINTRVNMLKQLGKKVILSRVDNAECYESVKDLNVECIGGSYLSPVMTKNELQNKFWHGDTITVKEDGVHHSQED